MNAVTKKKTVSRFPTAKISQVIHGLLKGKPFKIHVADASIGGMKIVRVVTPVWKSLRPAVRIGKILDAVNAKLTSQERDGILRFSVLTPEEYEAVAKNGFLSAPKVPLYRVPVRASKAKPLARQAAYASLRSLL